MAGATLRITIDDVAARAALARLSDAGADMTPLIRGIGKHLLATTRARFIPARSENTVR